jgi:hypothetical protein
LTTEDGTDPLDGLEDRNTRLEIDLMLAPTRAGHEDQRAAINQWTAAIGYWESLLLEDLRLRDWAQTHTPHLFQAWRGQFEAGARSWATTHAPDLVDRYLNAGYDEVAHDAAWHELAEACLEAGGYPLDHGMGDMSEIFNVHHLATQPWLTNPFAPEPKSPDEDVIAAHIPSQPGRHHGEPVDHEVSDPATTDRHQEGTADPSDEPADNTRHASNLADCQRAADQAAAIRQFHPPHRGRPR